MPDSRFHPEVQQAQRIIGRRVLVPGPGQGHRPMQVEEGRNQVGPALMMFLNVGGGVDQFNVIPAGFAGSVCPVAVSDGRV